MQSAPPGVQPLLQRNVGLAYYKSGRMLDAARVFSGLHAAFPGERDLTLLAADAYVQLGEPVKAVDLMRPLAASSPDDKAAAYVLGIALLESGRLDEARLVLDPILKDTDSAEGNFAIGLAMFTRQDYPAAVKVFARAAELNPQLARIDSYYGQALLFTGDATAAADAFRRQLARDANDYEANLRLAQILASKGLFAEAQPLLRRAVQLRPDAREARAELADTQAGRFRRAASPERGVAPGAPAPVVELERIGGGRLRLPQIELGRPAFLVFGSYNCPQFRSAAAALQKLSAEYAARAPFLLIYIREAHAGDQWQSTINQREHMAVGAAATLSEKQENARLCVRNLHLSFPAAVDGMDSAAEKAYGAWPSRVYVIGADGLVRYSTGLADFEFDARALGGAIREVTATRR